MNSIVSVIFVNVKNTRKLLYFFNEKMWTTFMLLKNRSITLDREKFMKTMNEIIVFLIMVIGVEKTVKLFWNIVKIMIGCGYTIRYLILKKNIKNIENIENIENKVNANDQTIGTVLLRLDKINSDMENINISVKNISENMDLNSTRIDVLKKSVGLGVVGTDYYSPF
jgi:hypothetical protein